MRLEGLILDVDGTLADTENLHREAFNQAFREFGLDWYWSGPEYARLLSTTGGNERIADYARARRWRPSGGNTSAGYLRALHQCKSGHYRYLLREFTPPPRPGVVRLLKECREQGVRMALASSSTRANVLQLLRLSLHIRQPGDYFQAIVSSDEVPRKKPAPQVYLQALRELDLAAHRCMAVEDSSNGLRAARDCGLETVITVHALTCKQHFEGASLVVDQLGEPEHPCKVLAGNAHGCNRVTPQLLNTLLEAAPVAEPLAQEQETHRTAALHL